MARGATDGRGPRRGVQDVERPERRRRHLRPSQRDRTARRVAGGRLGGSRPRLALRAVRPAAVERMIVYGSKARGDARPDSDLDVLLIVKNEAAGRKRELRRIGYLLAAEGDAAPSILAYTSREREARKLSGSPFRQA